VLFGFFLFKVFKQINLFEHVEIKIFRIKIRAMGFYLPFQQFYNCIMAAIFIGGGKWSTKSKPPQSH